MQFIKLIYESFCRSLIRFFDNRFVRNNDVDYYRIEMEKLRQNITHLEDVLIHKIEPLSANVGVGVENSEPTNWQPARQGYVSWETKRRELEQASRDRADQLVREAKVALASTKSIAELEAELLSED